MLNSLANLSFDNAKFNNRLAYLINFASVLIIIFCFIYYAICHWFIVSRIIIEGDIYHITPVQLTYIAQNRLYGTFFTLDIDGLKAAFQEIPWVREVSVSRTFPNTITVNIGEYKAIARIGDEELLTENGEVFDGASGDISLPVLYVANSRAKLAFERYKQIKAVLAKHNDSLSQLWMKSLQVTKFVTNNKLQIEICANDFTNGIDRLDKYWDKLHQINPNLHRIDLCYKNAIAINYESNILVNNNVKK